LINFLSRGYSINNGDFVCSSGINQPVSSDGRLWLHRSPIEVSINSVTILSSDSSNRSNYLVSTKPEILTATSPFWVYAPTIEVRWRATDQAVLSLIPEATSNTKPNRFSTAKIIGLILGLTVTTLIFGAVMIIWRFRRKKRWRDESNSDRWQKAELESKSIDLKESQADNDPIELPNRPNSPVELPADSQPKIYITQLATKGGET
jgi:hypothetical protein